MITAFDALVLGVVEGLTEYLPISSTAHLILTSDLLGITQTNFTKTFEIAIQGGAILAVLALYWRKFLDPTVVKKVAVAFLPTGILGLILYPFVKTYLIGNVTVVLWSLAVGGALMILFEYVKNDRAQSTGETTSDISYGKAFLIGLCQSVAMIPGVSRSAATIIGGMALGINRKTIVEFSFLLAVPTLAAATGLDLIKNYTLFSGDEFSLLAVGFSASFITAFIAIRFLLRYIERHTFIAFGVYRILLVFLFTLFII